MFATHQVRENPWVLFLSGSLPVAGLSRPAGRGIRSIPRRPDTAPTKRGCSGHPTASQPVVRAPAHMSDRKNQDQISLLEAVEYGVGEASEAHSAKPVPVNRPAIRMRRDPLQGSIDLGDKVAAQTGSPGLIPLLGLAKLACCQPVEPDFRCVALTVQRISFNTDHGIVAEGSCRHSSRRRSSSVASS